MKKPEWKLGGFLSVVTAAYLLCSIFGCLLYMLLPPFLSSIGARCHVYLLIAAALETEKNFWPEFLSVIAHLFVLVQMIFGFIALKTGKIKTFTLLTILEILLNCLLLVIQDFVGPGYGSGILLNIVYCVLLIRRTHPRISVRTTKSLKG